MKKAVSFLLVFLLAAGLLCPAEASAEPAGSVAQQSAYTAVWIANAMKILGITGADGSPVSEEKLMELAGQIKYLLDAAQNLTEDTLKPMIRSLLSQNGFSIGDVQLDRLISIFSSSEGQDEQSLSSRLQSLWETVSGFPEKISKTAGIFRTVRRSIQGVVDWFSHVKDLFH